MLAKSRVKSDKKYWVQLSQITVIGGKPRSPSMQFKLSGEQVKQHYEAIRTITPALQ